VITDVCTQFYAYEKPVSRGWKAERQDYTKFGIGDKSEKSLYRARNNLVTTINANITKYSKFYTMTTAEPIYDMRKFLDKFTNFKRRFKRAFGFDIPYVAVLERQYERQKKYNLEQAPWHIHLVIFLDAYLPIEKLSALWGLGYCWINAVEDYRQTGRYMAKYLTKENVAKNKKAVIKSENLKTAETVLLPEYIIPDKYDFGNSYIIYIEDLNYANKCEFREIHHF